MMNSPNRGQGKKKWAVTKCDGPLIAVCEFIQKKLSQHYWPCTYAIEINDFGDEMARFTPKNGADQPADFERMLRLATRIVQDERRVDITAMLNNVYLHGVWHVAKDKQGRYSHFKRGPAPETPNEQLEVPY